MDVRTGEVLAMASVPDYEPGAFIPSIDPDRWKAYQENSQLCPLKNRTISSYAPGSTMKVPTALAAAMNGLAGSRLTCDGYVAYGNHKVGCWLWNTKGSSHGTLTLPQGKGPFPAAVLITGSGAQDRDETLLGHKPFAVIADYLTRHGIVVLRFDDRGVGKSTGKYADATSADLATDANAAADYLMTRREIRHDAVGFIGHSEGGMIAPIAMADNDRIAFLIMLAGPGTALDKLMLSQRRLIGSQIGMSEAALDGAEPVMAAVFHAVASGATPEQGREAARAVLTPAAMASLGAPGADPDVVLNQVTGPWFSYFLKYDPAPNLRRIKVPLLALNGSLDRQVPPEDNLAAIRQATAGNPDATTIELPRLNHLFQTAKTGAVGEYADIPETVAPIALETMTDWLTKRFVRK